MSYSKIEKDGYTLYQKEGCPEIGVAGASVLEQDGLVFRDLEGTGELLPYEDWRLTPKERAEDLVQRLTPEEMMGLMLNSSYQPVPAMPGAMRDVGTYDGKTFPESQTAKPFELTDQQKEMLQKEGLRHILAARQKDVETAVKWSNGLQSLAESLPHGIPVNIATDPRHRVQSGDEVEFRNSSSQISKWPEGVGMAVVHDVELCREYADIVSKEYRALGITTMLGPQIDLSTDPRWFRFYDTLGADPDLACAMAQAYCDGLQTTSSTGGWGRESVVAMVKHWPGGGTGEGGRDAHYPFGKYAVYPGNRLEQHIRPFVEGAMKLKGGTKACGAVMPYYNIPWNQDTKYGQNVGNSYNEYIIKDLLIGKYGYQGVICTDWGVIDDMTPQVGMFVLGGKCHGVENLSIPERVLRMMKNGVNQFGDLDSRKYVEQAYALGCEQDGREAMDEILKLSAYKLLLNLFRLGLFENPYLDLEQSLKVVGHQEFVKKGLLAQRKSVVLLKNKEHVLPLQKGLKVYVPNRHIKEHYSFVRFKTPAQDVEPVKKALLEQYFQPVEDPACADAALVFIDSPFGSGGYDQEDLLAGQTGYRPISLQYRPYRADNARPRSIAGGDPREADDNRSYRGKEETTANEADLDLVIRAREQMGEKPVIVCIQMKNPTVLSELEPYADAVLAEFGVQQTVVLDAVTGGFIPSGRIPFIIPADMETVERHCEDVGDDMEPYQDEEGHRYGFGYGMNFDGVL